MLRMKPVRSTIVRETGRRESPPDRIFYWGLGLLLAFSFTYFCQGGGYNQNATLAEIREVVEHGRFNIDSWTDVTLDISRYNGKIYSNKSPTTFFFATPAYFAFYSFAGWLGADRSSAQFQLLAHHFLTFFCASIWGALLGLVLFALLGDLYPSLLNAQRLWLTLSLTLGSLVFVYSTVAFAHAFETFAVVLCFWQLVRLSDRPVRRETVRTGLAVGLVLLSNPVLLLAVLPAGVAWLRRTRNAFAVGHIAGWSLVPLLPLFAYNQYCFDFFLRSNRTLLDPAWTEPGLFLGVFARPDLSRLLTVYGWSWRSLLPALPLVYLGLWSLVRGHFPKEHRIFPVAVIAVLTLVLLSFNGWHGGSCYSPRYYLPATVLLLVAAVAMFEKHPRWFTGLAVWQLAICYLVAASILWMGPEVRSPLRDVVLPYFWKGQFQKLDFPLFPLPKAPFHRYNLGTLIGIPGHWSLLPLVLIQTYLIGWLLRVLRINNDTHARVAVGL